MLNRKIHDFLKSHQENTEKQGKEEIVSFFLFFSNVCLKSAPLTIVNDIKIRYLFLSYIYLLWGLYGRKSFTQSRKSS